jgi:hypothetical protein
MTRNNVLAGRSMRATQIATADQPGHVPEPRRRTDQVGVFVPPEAARQFTALAEITAGQNAT